MKKLLIASVALSLGDCATIGKHPVHMPKPKPPVVKVAPAPITPNAIVKHRWTDRFKHHPKWFHSHDPS